MKILTILTTMSAAIFPATVSYSADMYQVAAGATVTINEHDTCKKVTNGGENPIMVPTRSANEWMAGQNAFLNNIAKMNKVNVNACNFLTTFPSTAYCVNYTDTSVVSCDYNSLVSSAGGSWGSVTGSPIAGGANAFEGAFYIGATIGSAPVLLYSNENVATVYSQKCVTAGLGSSGCKLSDLAAKNADAQSLMTKTRQEELAAGSYDTILRMYAKANACILADAPGYYVLYESTLFWDTDYIVGAFLVQCS